MEPDKIIIIVIVTVVCLGSIFAHCAWINEADVDISCKLWAEQWDDLIKQENEELRRAIKLTSCTSKQFEEELNQMRTCTAKPTVKEVVGTFDKKQEDALYDEEPKPKKLEPLICKMCGGTVAKKGDIYECEYCGLRYEWR